MAKKGRKKAKKSTAASVVPRKFSLVALHGKLQDAIDRLGDQPNAGSAKRLMSDLTSAQAMLDCGQTMSPDISGS